MTRRDTIFKHFLDGLTYREIAEKVGLSRQRVQQIVRPPKPVYDAVKDRASGKCERCGIHVQDGHVHHVESSGRTVETFNQMEQLLYLCPSCHRTIHVKRLGPHSRMLQIGIRVTPKQKREFERAAASRSMSLSAWLRWLAHAELKRSADVRPVG